MPILVGRPQWMQIFSRRDSPTSSFVRIAIKSIKRPLDKFKRDVNKLPNGANKTSLWFMAFEDGINRNRGYIGIIIQFFGCLIQQNF